eukprot:3047573-Pleurochrysis_carterae.AAC.1
MYPCCALATSSLFELVMSRRHLGVSSFNCRSGWVELRSTRRQEQICGCGADEFGARIENPERDDQFLVAWMGNFNAKGLL